MSVSTNKIPLNEFLKVLNSTSISIQRAMVIASKIYKSHNTPAELGKLTDSELRALGVDKPEDRRDALAAFRKAGYRSAALAGTAAAGGSLTTTRGGADVGAKTAARTSAASGQEKKKAQLKRKRGELQDDYAQKPSHLIAAGPSVDKSVEEVDHCEFNEILDPEALRSRFVVVNRTPVMAAWATVVAERLGFQREEALSIASVYTEINAISKGISLGIYDERKGKSAEFKRDDEAQPYVELMGRRPVYQLQSGQWRALLKNEPVEPAPMLSYIRRSFRQTLPYTIGAMRLLAESFHSPKELNEKGYALYTVFRPGAGKWGERAQMLLADILDLRKRGEEAGGEDGKMASVMDVLRKGAVEQEAGAKEPSVKKPRLPKNTSADSFISTLLKDPLIYEEEL